MNLNWRTPDADLEKTRLWVDRTKSAAPPVQAWYWAEGFGEREATPVFLEELRQTFWPSGAKARVMLNLDAKVEEFPYPEGGWVVRVSMPGLFVTSFSAGGRAFVLCEAMSAKGTTVDYIATWDKTLTRRVVASSQTQFSGLSAEDMSEAPAPTGVLRAMRASAGAGSAAPQPVLEPPERSHPVVPVVHPHEALAPVVRLPPRLVRAPVTPVVPVVPAPRQGQDARPPRGEIVRLPVPTAAPPNPDPAPEPKDTDYLVLILAVLSAAVMIVFAVLYALS